VRRSEVDEVEVEIAAAQREAQLYKSTSDWQKKILTIYFPLE
jgi:lipopolysaccharide biosynthesis regulator YciM